jgi:hypothetical protein
MTEGETETDRHIVIKNNLPNRMIPGECFLTNVAFIGFDFFMNLSSMNFQFALYYKFDFANVAFERSEICMKGCNVDHQC